MPTRQLIPHLDIIAAARKHYVRERKAQTPIEAVRALASMQKRPLPVLTGIATSEQPAVTLIAQLRATSSDTSKIEALAQELAAAGVDALALFTDDGLDPHGLDDLVALTRSVNLPVIGQDVIVDEYQIVESRAAGASALVLRTSTMDKNLLRTLVSTTQRNRMTAIVEANSVDEVIYANSLSPYVIAISQIDAWTGEPVKTPAAELRAHIPMGTRVMLAESLSTMSEIQAAINLQVDAVIVEPEFLLDSRNAAELHTLLRRTP
jgi:indole-3-glycerol phosphate synthase